jgi:hypothetical protein
MSSKRPAVTALLIGVVFGAVCFGLVSLFNIGAADFKHALGMARDLLAGRDPYAHEPGPYWIPYPLPAGFLALPVAAFPDTVAAGVFIGVSVGLLCWGILRSGESWRLAMLFSWPLLYAVLFAQWSPLLCAMWFFPTLAPLVLCKPNIALPMLLSGRPRVSAICVAGTVVIASLVLKPDWPWVWLQQTTSYQGAVPPLLYGPLSALILLNLARWRDRRAWLVLSMAVMPQRVFYDQLALLLVAASPRQMFWLICASWSSFLALWISPDMAHMPGGWQTWILVGHYLPATAVVTGDLWISFVRKPLRVGLPARG